MQLENQVCSLEQSKKLKELGVVQNSEFFWSNDFTGERKKRVILHISQIQLALEYVKRSPMMSESHYIKEMGYISAFTVAELGVMLPEYYPSWRFVARQTDTYKKHKLSNSKKDIRWITTVITKDKVKDGNMVTTRNEFDRYGLTEAKSRAMLLIALLENEVINVKDVNKRLIKK